MNPGCTLELTPQTNVDLSQDKSQILGAQTKTEVHSTLSDFFKFNEVRTGGVEPPRP